MSKAKSESNNTGKEQGQVPDQERAQSSLTQTGAKLMRQAGKSGSGKAGGSKPTQTAAPIAKPKPTSTPKDMPDKITDAPTDPTPGPEKDTPTPKVKAKDGKVDPPYTGNNPEPGSKIKWKGKTIITFP